MKHDYNSMAKAMEHSTLAQAIEAAGLGIVETIDDGEIHRFEGSDDSPGKENCWYVDYGEGGAYGSWKSGEKHTWYSGTATPSDKEAIKRKMAAAQLKREKETKEGYEGAKVDAYCLYEISGIEQVNHHYVHTKNIRPYQARQLTVRNEEGTNHTLLVPIYYEGELVNVQQISVHGSKWFLKGARIMGCNLPLAPITDRVIICEGWATGCSLHEYTGDPVVVAFNASNIEEVAISISEQYPGIQIIIAADNDVKAEQETGTNTGLHYGELAAEAVGGKCIYPDFTDEDFEGSDFNDYLINGGEL